MAEMLVDGAKLDACLDAEADAIRAKTGVSTDIAFDYANNKGFADAIAAIPSGGTATNFSTGTFTFSSSANTVEISCDFEPDYILIQGNLTQNVSLWGVRMLWIVRDDEALMYCDTNQSSLASNIYGLNEITDLNNSGTTANAPAANYQNNILTIRANGNRAYTNFSASVDYRYFLFAL